MHDNLTGKLRITRQYFFKYFKYHFGYSNLKNILWWHL